MLSSFDRGQILSTILFFLGIILVGGGLIYSLKSSSSNNDIVFESGSSVQGAQTQSAEPKITVDVEGAVITPGVYNLSVDSRVKDALIAAGGLSGSADRAWVSKNLNLARKLVEADKLYIPSRGEVSLRETSSTSLQTSNLININSASTSELDSLPGIGLATAQKIINGRPYSSISDLLTKKIIKSSVFEKIKDKITY